MKQKDKENLIRSIPMIVLVVAVGTVTHYDLFYSIIAGAIGGLIGYFLLKFIKRSKK